MKHSIIDAFLLWAEKSFRDEYPEAEVVRCPETTNPACYLELKTSVGIGRITVWTSGSYSKEYLGFEPTVDPIMEVGGDLKQNDFAEKFNDIRVFLSPR